MQMGQVQENRIEALARPLILAVQWAFYRHIQPVEGLSLAALVFGWNLSLADDQAFDSSPSYAALDAVMRPFTRERLPTEYGWAILLWLLAAHFLLAYVLSAWSYWRTGGVWDEFDWRVRWGRRLRFGGLAALTGWWAIVTVLIGYANVASTGWKVYFALAIWTGWAALRLAYDFGTDVIPWLPRRWQGGRGR